jgi:predicted ATPase
VTFLFTDIEGSTALLHELGDRYTEVLAEHHRVIREAFSRNHGVEVDTQGDAFFVAFARARDAVLAAGEAQNGLADGPVRVRMGIHTGEPVITDEGYVGIDIHRAARVMSAGHGGQVLVSETTAGLLDSTVELRDLGEHRLKDLTAPQRLFQLGDDDFRPLKTLYRTNLPIQPTPLVGRERELEEAGSLIRSHRLVTLIGPGGSGKTRLALQLAAEAVDAYPDGVFWVPLQAIRDPALVENAIGASVGADGTLIGHVAKKRLVLLLDNFEQVVDAAPTVSSILAEAENVRVLVTSREPLRLDSERRYPVEPLAVQDATTLFIERAQAVAPDFRATSAVEEICKRLDSLPLAIELAAARVALLDSDELLARLDRRLPLLKSSSRDAPPRQQTLRAAIEWSYELLDDSERALFRRLSVFAGHCSLDAAEVIGDTDLDTLESLVVKSLVRRYATGRFGMLDTIREYALELLEESPEAEAVHRRHAEYFLGIAEGANLNAALMGRRPARLDVAILEQDNIRAALTWAIARSDAELGLALAAAMEQFWATDDPRQGVRWFEALFELDTGAVPDEILAHALRAYGSSAHIAGDLKLAEDVWEQSLALWDELGDEHGRAVLLHRLGISAMHEGELDRARLLVGESDEIHGRTGDLWGRTQTVGTLGAIAREAGDDVGAFALLGESAEMAAEAQAVWWRGGMLAEQALLRIKEGRSEEAEPFARESLEIAAELRDYPGRVFGVGIFAWIAADRSHIELAGRLWGAIEDERTAAPLGGWQRHRAACEAKIEDIAHLPEFEHARAEGRELDLDQAVELALTGPA